MGKEFYSEFLILDTYEEIEMKNFAGYKLQYHYKNMEMTVYAEKSSLR